jgi:uncharacterized protein
MYKGVCCKGKTTAMASILIAGGTGLIGRRLSQLLQKQGHEVSLLSRRASNSGTFPAYEWDPARGIIDHEAVRRAEVVINLAGAGVADARWTDARKREIIDSRVNSAHLLLESFRHTGHNPQCYLSSAAIGYYGNRSDTVLEETAAPGKGFLPDSCVQWEKAVQEVAAAGIRTVVLRTGIVLSVQGGALEKMLMPARLGAGTYFGDGSQWYSWIHIDDVCRLFLHAIEHPDMAGTYNAVAPNPTPNKAFAAALMQAMNRPQILIPAPAFALRFAMGEMADVVLDSARVSSKKAEQAGFRFDFPELEPAILDLLVRKI